MSTSKEGISQCEKKPDFFENRNFNPLNQYKIKEVCILLGMLFCMAVMAVNGSAASVPAPHRYESFEQGIPANWILQGRGKLSTSPWHYKEGKKSLQWDFKSGDVIRVNNTLGSLTGRGGWKNLYTRSFAMFIYMEKPIDKPIRLEFRTDNTVSAYVDIPLNYQGWQSVFMSYHKTLENKVSAKTNNILIKAPTGRDGRILLDLIVYNGFIDGRTSRIPLAKPWTPPAPGEQIKEAVKNLSKADIAAIKKMEKEFVFQKKITAQGYNPQYYNNVIKKLNALDIVEDSHGIRGVPIQIPHRISIAHRSDQFFTLNGVKSKLYCYSVDIRKTIGPVGVMFLRGVSPAQDKELSKRMVRFFRYFLDQGFNTSMGNPSLSYVHHRGALTWLVCCLKDELAKAKLLQPMLDLLQYDFFAVFNPVRKDVSMDYFGGTTEEYIMALLNEDVNVQAQGLQYLSGKLSAEVLISDWIDGFKDDGCGYHHSRNSFGYMSNALIALSTIVKRTANTTFALSPAAVKVIEQAALNAYYYSMPEGKDLSFPLSMQGRRPFSPRFRVSANRVKLILFNLAQSSTNKDVIQACVNLNPNDKAFARKHGMQPKFTEINHSLPFGGSQMHRKNGWLAFAAAYGKYFTGDEIYTGYGRYDRYISKGSLDIIGPKGFYASGTDPKGWDWGRINGTSVIYYPPEKLKCRTPYVTLTNEHGFFGGISWRKRNGCFTMQQENIGSDYPNVKLSGKKSYFFIDDRIYAMGSNISSNESQYPVQTNLYQKSFYDKAFKKLNESCKTTRHLIDPVGNGYYVPGSQNLHIEQKAQENYDDQGKKKTRGSFGVAYIDHGKAPKDASYFYVVFPFCERGSFEKFGDRDYQILEQDANAHVIHDKISGIYAGIFFRANAACKLPQVLKVSDNCMIMYEEKNGTLKVAAGNPDVNRRNTKKRRGNPLYRWRESVLKPLTITFVGPWKLKDPVEGVKVLSSDKKQTMVELSCINGKTFNFTLRKNQ